MMIDKIIQDISKHFGKKIKKITIENVNEVYLEVEPEDIVDICTYLNLTNNYPLVLMFASDERKLINSYAIYYAFGLRESNIIITVKIAVASDKAEFMTISEKIPAAYRYEMEIKDLYGLKFKGEPNDKRLVFHNNWPAGNYPLRKDFNFDYKPPVANENVDFKRVEGEGIYEIPVGPVHAGIIEPGHFRFSVAGEPIINLEAQLYFVHKGIEKLSEQMSIEKCLYLAERISGDETFSNSLTYCMAVEKIAGVEIPQKAEYSRTLFAELERLTSHLGDLAGICLDVAYGFAAFQFRMLRGWAYLIADELCGMRFLRSVNKIGGVRKDFIKGKEKSIIGQLKKLETELKDTVNIIKSNSMFIDRIENTGVLNEQIARDLNAVGPAGRAAGIDYDVRKWSPYAAYSKIAFNVPKHHNGDVNCRMNTKIEECFESLNIMQNVIESLIEGNVFEPVTYVNPYKCAYAITESPRGENIHWIMTGENNTIFRYKIRTPSFCNWPVLCHAVRGNIVPDFPLINKSFNLSYAGNDL